MIAQTPRVSPTWLALREPADAAARARELVERVEKSLPASGRRVIHDLGCGTGAMGRWLAPLLTGPQRWVAHDRDGQLLALAAARLPAAAADGAPVAVEARRTELGTLDARDLSGATLITASALLDLLTADEISRLAAVCAGAGCPILLTISVVGHVAMAPPAPLDRRVGAAFDAHQRRATERGSLLGPDAVAVAVEEFSKLGAEILVRPSPWQLGPSQAGLIAEWFTGWTAAAFEQEGELSKECEFYTRRRLAQATAGQLTVTVDHADVLVLL